MMPFTRFSASTRYGLHGERTTLCIPIAFVAALDLTARDELQRAVFRRAVIQHQHNSGAVMYSATRQSILPPAGVVL